MAADRRNSHMLGGQRQRVDDFFELLTDSRRRYVLYRLRSEGPSQLTTLARDIASREADTSVERVPADCVRAVYLDLYHTHVPKLATFGVVHYSEQLGELALCVSDESAKQCLDAAARLEGIPVEN